MIKSYTDLVEEVAMIIYWYEGGTHPEEYEITFGQKKENWRNIYKFQEGQPELVEHERDEYRCQANQVIDYLLKQDLLAVTKPVLAGNILEN